MAVCQAVQHAHQKGIIHRDLKPSNVLVTEVDGRPTPKVIDFGVAKATEFSLTDQSLADTGAIVGTPTSVHVARAGRPARRWTSTPGPTCTRLGVILRTCSLAGSPPIDARQFTRGAILEMLRMVREVDPPWPSTKVSTSDALPSISANRDIEPGALEAGVTGRPRLDRDDAAAGEGPDAALTRRPTGSRPTSSEHLAHEPVVAAPPSRGYRLRKFVR